MVSRIYSICGFCVMLIALTFGFNPFMDRDLYKIDWAGPVAAELGADGEIKKDEFVSVTTKFNEQYQCSIPNPHDQESASKLGYDGMSPHQLMTDIFFAQKTCSYRIETFWTYELCHGKHLRQYHETKDVNQKSQVQEYFLGFHEKVKNNEKHDVKKPTKLKSRKIEGVDLPYYESYLVGGTICDLTGKPRQATILYICQPEGRGEVYEFKEIRTCEYELIVLTSVLCKHPEFKPKNPEINKIKCFASEGSPNRPKQLDMDEHSGNPFEKKEGVLDADSISIHIEGNVQDGKSTGPQVHIRRKAEPAPVTDQIGPATDSTMIRDFLQGDHCLQGGAGWWKHEYCHGKFVRQYHDDSQGRQIVQLGQWTEADHLNWLKDKDNKKPRPVGKRKHLSLFYGQGSFCELTGKPRQTEVKLKCVANKDHPHSMAVYLLEPKTCEYVLGVESPLFCPLLDKADDNGLLKNIEL